MKNWKKNLLSFALALVMTAVIIPTLFAAPAYAVASTSWTKLGGSTGGQTIGTNGQTKYYYIDANTTCSNSNTGGSGLTIAGGATVYIYIPANVTLTCTGKAGSGVTGGGAGIWLPSNSKLYIIGNGAIKATGGDAAAGSNGAAGRTTPGTYGTGQEVGHDCLWIYSGGGGNGGNGGGGAGAGIGTPGGAGGAGGTGGVGAGESGTGPARFLIHVSYTDKGWNQWGYYQGAAGTAGANGSAAADMGTLGIQTTITQSITGGAASSTAGAYGGTGNVRSTDVFYWPAPKCHYRWIAYGGAGGGGGGSGYAAANIGKGGGGGGGGGGGQGGGQAYTTGGLNNEPTSYFGGGGTGYKSGTGSTKSKALYTDVPAATGDGNLIRYGGTGAGAGTAKAAGTATLGAIVTYNPQNGAATWANNNVTVGVAMPSTTKPTYNGFTFAGWYDDPVGGTQYYNANNASVRPMTNCDITLYAHWTTNNGIGVANETQIVDAFKWAPVNGAVTVKMTGNINLTSSIVMTLKQTITLDLNGKTLTQTKTAHTDIFDLGGPTTLHIQDSVGGGTITRATNCSSVCGIYLYHNDAVLYLHSGTITNMNNQYWGSGVSIANGKFYMDGGTISNCWAGQYGGGVGSKGLFVMSGGVIESCTAVQNGGGVYAEGTFNMSGGVIWKNRVTSTASGIGKGGGICVGGTTTMTGGYVINNTVNRNVAYGAVGIFGNCTFNMQGGIIWGNKHNGGSAISGVGIDNNGHYTKTGGLVDPAIDLTLENPLAPIVHITMKDDIKLTDVRSADGTVLTTADSIDFVGNQNVTWDLNGHTLDLNKYHYILVDAGATFTLKDSGKGGNITNGCAGYYYGSSGMGYSNAWRNWGGAVYVRGATFNMESGIIQNCTTRHFGGGVAVWGGTFNMTGGTIQNCTTYTTSDKIGSESGGGGVYIHSNSSFTMTNGTIKDCSSITFGGGVASNGIFEMTGGTISGCVSTTHSGGVFNGGTFNFSGGTITGCTAGTTGGGIDTNGVVNMTGGLIENCKAKQGGGVWIWTKGGVFNMTDATIRNCEASAYGGGVYVNGPNGKFTMTRSTIEGCKAYYATGGGVDNDAIFTMTDSIIKDCSVVGCGGALYNYSTGTFTMSGNSKIINCSATAYDATWNGRGGAICNIGTINMENGEISGCTTANETLGAGGVEQSSGTFNLQDGILWGNKNTVTGAVNSLYQTGGTLNKTGGYIDPKTIITLDPNGGTAGTETVTVYYGDTAMPKIEKLPTRAGYSFGGFFDAAEGGTQYYDAEGNNIALSKEKIWDKLDETMTLYARWTPNNYTISYDANGGEGAPEAMTAAYDAEVTLSSTVPTKTGYAFKEWNTAKDGSGTAYAAEAKVRNLASGGETVTLYAQWTPSTYTVTLNNGESVDDGSVTATYDAVLPNVTVPTWEKHVFEGYYTGENGEGDRYIDKDGKGEKVWDKTSDTTLYAFWKDSAKIESMDLLLGGDIGMRYHVAVNDPELKESGTMTVSIGSKKPSEKTVPYSEAPKDESGAILFPFTVSSIQMAEPVTVEFKDKDGKVFASDAKSVEDYYNLVENSSATGDQKEMVRTLVNYGYHAQQALSKTNGWSIGQDYAASSQHGELSSSANDLKVYKPVISGTGTNVKDIQLSLLLDNKTTLCIYVQTKDGSAPAVTVDGASVTPEDNGDGWWLVRIPNIDALNLSAMHTVYANGYTVYLSALSYASVAGKNTIDAMRALLDYYQATLTANGKKMLTSATVTQSEYDYTGQKIKPVLTVMAGNEEVDDYHVEWNGDLINAGTYTGLVTKEGYVGGVTVKVKINPVKVTAPAAETTQFTYDGKEHTFLATPLVPLYTLENNSATDAGEYTAIARLMDEKNTCWTDGTTEPKTYDWWIDPMEVPVPHVEKTEFTYDGTQKTVLTVDEVNSYTVTGNTGTEAGDYEAIVELKDKKNNCWNDEGKTTEDKTIKWSIVIVKTKVEKPKAIVTSFEYDGTEKTLVIAASENYTVTGNTGTDAGEYTATVTLNENCCWSDETTEPETISWAITKKEIAVPSYEVKNDLTYTGEVQTGVTVAENAAYTLTGNTGRNAASYTATLALTDPTNTCWSDEGKTTDAKTIVWSIARKEIGIPQAATGLVYNGAEQIGVKAGEGYGLIGVTKATNAGSYTATAELTDKLNTCWSDGTKGYQTIEWSIAKADPKVMKDGISVTYRPNGGSAEFSGSMTVEGTFSYDPASENTATFTPNDTQNYNTVTVEADVTKDPTPVSMNVSLSGKTKEETK